MSTLFSAILYSNLKKVLRWHNFQSALSFWIVFLLLRVQIWWNWNHDFLFQENLIGLQTTADEMEKQFQKFANSMKSIERKANTVLNVSQNLPMNLFSSLWKEVDVFFFRIYASKMNIYKIWAKCWTKKLLRSIISNLSFVEIFAEKLS